MSVSILIFLDFVEINIYITCFVQNLDFVLS